MGLWVPLSVLLLCAGCQRPPRVTRPPLRVLCGSSLATPLDEIQKAFSAARDIEVEVDLGGSETLLPKILAGGRADIFVCHDPFEEKLRAKGLATESVSVGYLEPVLAVRPGNPKGIRSIADLGEPGVRLGIGDPRYSTCGALFVERALPDPALRDRVLGNVELQARTHAEVANGLILGPLDAVVVWNFVTALYPGKLESVAVGVPFPATRVTIVGLTAGARPEARDAFLDWCRQPSVTERFRAGAYTRDPRLSTPPAPSP